MAVIDSYSESNAPVNTEIWATSGEYSVGQSFTGDGSVLGRATFYLAKAGSPTGSAIAKIYTHSGTFGSSSVPTGAALATSDNFDVSTLTTSPQLIDFTFSGGNQITLSNGTHYIVAVEYTNGNGSNTVKVYYDITSPTHAGNMSVADGRTPGWTAFSGDDAAFYVYSTGSSPSSSLSPSASQSPSPSISPSVSPSSSISASPSPSPLPPPFFGMKIAKPNVDVLKDSDPNHLIFSSEYGTLKYFTKQAVSISFDASALDISAKGVYAHNLGYYPYVEVYVRVYTGGTPTGDYEYCPFFGAGASIAYSANVKIDTTNITVYGEISGVSSAVWHFDFLIFVFKNNLNL